MYVIYTIFVFYINTHIHDNIYTHIYEHIDTREMVLRRMLRILPCFAFCAISTHIRLRILPFVHTYVSCMVAHFVAHDTCCAFCTYIRLRKAMLLWCNMRRKMRKIRNLWINMRGQMRNRRRCIMGLKRSMPGHIHNMRRRMLHMLRKDGSTRDGPYATHARPHSQ